MNALTLPGVSIKLIKQVVANHYRIPVDKMAEPTRLRRFAWPRQIAMTLAREFTGKSRAAIGRHFGGRDPTTVLAASRAVKRRAAANQQRREELAFLRSFLDRIAPKPAEDQMPDLYEELGIGRDASPEAIKAAHRREVQKHHPDRGGDKAKFQAVQLAYDTLKDGDRRRRYDETGETARAEKADPVTAQLAMLFDSLIDQMLQDGMPIETADMRKIAAEALEQKLNEIKSEKAKMERSLRKAKDLARRFKRKRRAKGPDVIGTTLARKSRDLASSVGRIGEAIEVWERAKVLLASYDYSWDKPPEASWPTRGTSFEFISMHEFGRPRPFGSES